jgi:hypothetical protein
MQKKNKKCKKNALYIFVETNKTTSETDRKEKNMSWCHYYQINKRGKIKRVSAHRVRKPKK